MISWCKKYAVLLLTTLFLVLFFQNSLRSQPTEFWGTTSLGGNDFGTIFKTDGNGNNHQVIYDFGKNPGKAPVYNLVKSYQGELFGLTQGGGLYSEGLFFKLNTLDSTTSKLFDFNKFSKGEKSTEIIETDTNIFYGMTSSGSISALNQYGSIYSYNVASKEFETHYTFELNFSGGHPKDGFCKDSNGVLYGTLMIGPMGLGTIFSYDISKDNFEIIHVFSDSSKGYVPNGLTYKNDKLYGSCSYGGIYDQGVLFEFNLLDSSFNKLWDFNGIRGSNPKKSMVFGTNGRLYGGTIEGGSQNLGVFFEFDTSSKQLAIKGNFGRTGQNNNFITNHIVLDNVIYGACTYTGAYDDGMIYSYNISTDTYKVLYSYKTNDTEGYRPVGLTVLDSARLYIQTSHGGIENKNNGTIGHFNRIQLSHKKVLNYSDNTEGSNPISSLLQGTDNLLYGIAYKGGEHQLGVVYSIDPNTGNYSVKHSFGSISKGPLGTFRNSFCHGPNNRIYAMSISGGDYGDGTIWSFDPNTDSVSVLFSFHDSVGMHPRGSLIYLEDGYLYGMTDQGGVKSAGVIFRFDPVSKNYEILLEFGSNTLYGCTPQADLVYIGDNKVAGLASGCGKFNYGTLFNFDISTKEMDVKFDFDYTVNGGSPLGSLILHKNVLYGVSAVGGLYQGILFKYTLDNERFSKIIDFTSSNYGGSNYGGMILASNGKMYGLSGGIQGNFGLLYEFNPESESYKITHSFSGDNGQDPLNSLIEINGWVGIKKNTSASTFTVYPNPSRGNFQIELEEPITGTVQIFNSLGLKVYDRQLNRHLSLEVKLPSSLVGGIYIIRLVNGDSVFSQKLVLRRE